MNGILSAFNLLSVTITKSESNEKTKRNNQTAAALPDVVHLYSDSVPLALHRRGAYKKSETWPWYSWLPENRC